MAILEHLGFTVIVPPLQCCGLPTQSNGDFDAARAYARRNVAWLAPYARQGIPIVGTSASCMTAIKADYQHVLTLQDEATRTVAAGVWDFMEFLRHLHEAGRLDTDFQPIQRGCPITRPASSRRMASAARRWTCWP